MNKRLKKYFHLFFLSFFLCITYIKESKNRSICCRCFIHFPEYFALQAAWIMRFAEQHDVLISLADEYCFDMNFY